MKEKFEEIQALYKQFEECAMKQIVKGNRAAGAKARKATTQLAAAMKEFRKMSNDAAKADIAERKAAKAAKAEVK